MIDKIDFSLFLVIFKILETLGIFILKITKMLLGEKKDSSKVEVFFLIPTTLWYFGFSSFFKLKK